MSKASQLANGGAYTKPIDPGAQGPCRFPTLSPFVWSGFLPNRHINEDILFPNIGRFKPFRVQGCPWSALFFFFFNHGVARSRTRLSDFIFPFHFHALGKEMATHSSVLAWRIPGTGEPGGLLSMGSHRIGHDWSDLAAAAAAANFSKLPLNLMGACFLLKLRKSPKPTIQLQFYCS